MSAKNWQKSDIEYMSEAIQLAWKGLYTTEPNPRVGCILVKDGEVVGSGWHVRAGEAHAEINALKMAGERAQGATAYVTLEPCSHFGKTPPCADALVKAGVARVVAAMEDPNPEVKGNGFKRLQDAGVDVSFGLLEEQARALNPGFIKRMSNGLPFVRVKLAMSVDGRTAMASGESKWITGPDARSDVQRLRARSSAIVTGIGTVLSDDASLNVRANELGLENAESISARQPMRVVLDRSARLPLTAKVIQSPGNVLWAVAEDSNATKLLSQNENVELTQLTENSDQLLEVMQMLARRGCNEVLVEAGPTLSGAVLQAGLCDELVVYMASKLMGSNARPLMELPINTMSDAQNLQLTDIRSVGADVRMTFVPESRIKTS